MWTVVLAKGGGQPWDIIPVLVTAVVVGIVLGIFKGAEYLIEKRRNGKIKAIADAHWTDVTGEQRPVSVAECKTNHVGIERELRRGSKKMQKLTDSVQDVSTDLTELRKDLGAAVDLRIRDATSAATKEHEQGPLHRRSRALSSSDYPKSKG